MANGYLQSSDPVPVDVQAFGTDAEVHVTSLLISQVQIQWQRKPNPWNAQHMAGATPGELST